MECFELLMRIISKKVPNRNYITFLACVTVLRYITVLAIAIATDELWDSFDNSRNVTYNNRTKTNPKMSMPVRFMLTISCIHSTDDAASLVVFKVLLHFFTIPVINMVYTNTRINATHLKKNLNLNTKK